MIYYVLFVVSMVLHGLSSCRYEELIRQKNEQLGKLTTDLHHCERETDVRTRIAPRP